MNNEYHFTTHWRVKGEVDEIYHLIADAERLPEWWPSVYLDATELEPGDPETRVGRVIDLFTKGWLPYTLRWKFELVEVDYPRGYALEAEGDFVGRGEWSFEQEGEFVNIIYDWRILAEKPLLKTLTPLLRPVFSANHQWAMARGLESLELELARQHAPNPDARANIPPPPGPTTPMTFLLPLMGIAAGTILLLSLLRPSRSSANPTNA